VLVLRGEAGSGKTSLLDHVAARTPPGLLTRAAGVEVETEIAYSALHQVCSSVRVRWKGTRARSSPSWA
jgi:ABC-type molybdenum transport system ATPase subunit/photorepair protein PhrA